MKVLRTIALCLVVWVAVIVVRTCPANPLGAERIFAIVPAAGAWFIIGTVVELCPQIIATRIGRYPFFLRLRGMMPNVSCRPSSSSRDGTTRVMSLASSPRRRTFIGTW